jgi:hypothetical protein
MATTSSLTLYGFQLELQSIRPLNLVVFFLHQGIEVFAATHPPFTRTDPLSLTPRNICLIPARFRLNAQTDTPSTSVAPHALFAIVRLTPNS